MFFVHFIIEGKGFDPASAFPRIDWEQIEGQSVYLRKKGVTFEQFDHEKNGKIPEGVFFVQDQPTTNRTLDAVRHELAKRS
ncbi:hypothetical protein [Saccharibacillus endophyticus]|uniref:Uncharacterized protein n=1 Tax=Saccharibacillus endophyticus TaxID=2060666 RepID=A0ABQ1ZSA2_9BACL|nr:hypothetical protein [Saccharibacillus endophyticus]GGH76537.1 hypothetical protein GCM10007362_18930 [Saccharibacillus endophyticus]